MQNKKFSKERFKRYHKGGSLGKTLLLVKDVMIKGTKIPIIDRNKNILGSNLGLLVQKN